MNFRVAVLAAFLFLLAFIPARAEEGARVVLVLDASGSMWGQIDGKSKMEIAKEVVGKIVANWKPGDELGLVAYGHREKGSCTDIEVLREPGPLDAADYMRAVNALSPKGKTPMTAAVQAWPQPSWSRPSATRRHCWPWYRCRPSFQRGT